MRLFRGESGFFLSSSSWFALPAIRLIRLGFTLYLIKVRRTELARLPESSQYE